MEKLTTAHKGLGGDPDHRVQPGRAGNGAKYGFDNADNDDKEMVWFFGTRSTLPWRLQKLGPVEFFSVDGEDERCSLLADLSCDLQRMEDHAFAESEDEFDSDMG